ncbi:MAG: biopolymer transporter ExbD [bacterium]|nr:biopolymer transporter ExbD [Gammaproteobacteria bacterium]HIL96705.1 biopolymer transporter ExbD [Pseudomonadales bacterium]
MRRSQKRRNRQTEAADLDVTPFMNLMIVLVPVLLLSLVFTHTAVIDLNFPTSEGQGDLDPEQVHLEVQILKKALIIRDGRAIIKRLPVLANGKHDLNKLSLTLQEIKSRLPGKRDATILLESDTDYQTLVFVMDRVRAYRVKQSDRMVLAELFPVLSLGDAPASKGGEA